MQSKMSGKMEVTISRIQSTFILKPGLKVCPPENFSISQLGKKKISFSLYFVKCKKEQKKTFT